MRVPAGHLDHLVHYGGRERRVSTETWTSPILAIGMCTVGSTLRSGPVPTERVPLRDRYINSYYGGCERRISTEVWTSPILAIGMCTVGSAWILISPRYVFCIICFFFFFIASTWGGDGDATLVR
jgi:hypothetical protein